MDDSLQPPLAYACELLPGELPRWLHLDGTLRPVSDIGQLEGFEDPAAGLSAVRGSADFTGGKVRVVSDVTKLKPLPAQRDELQEQIDLIRWVVSEPALPSEAPPVEEHKFPAPHEKLTDWDVVGVSENERGVLKTAMEEGESVSAAKRRLYPILNEELSRLQNQEALLGASTPESVSARRKEVESLLGILARVGDA